MKYKFFKFFLTIAFFYYCYNAFVDKIILNTFIKNIQIINLLPIFFFSLLSLFFIFSRFYYLVKNISGIKKKFKIINIFFKSLLISQLPIPVLAEGYKAYELKEISNQREKSIYIVLIERISGLISNLILITILFNAFIYKFYYNYFYICLILTLIFLIILLKFRSIFLMRIFYLNYIYLYIKNIKNISKIIFFTLVYSVANQITSLITVIYTLSLFYNLELVFSITLFIQLSNLIISLPIFVNGIGIREALYGLIFYKLLDLDTSFSILSASLVNSANLINLVLLFSIFNLFFFIKIKK